MIVLGILISFERKNMLVAERFIQKFAREYGKHPVRTDGDSTWYPQACRFLKLHHHTHSYYYEKSIIIERTIQYIKKIDRTECFDDYFPCRKKNCCKLSHVWNWLNLFIGYHNKQLQIVK